MFFKFLLFLCLLIIPVKSHGWMAVTLGPMLHYYFGKTESRMSFGVEVAYWSFREPLPLSVDLGFEFDEEKIRIYSELQTGMITFGTSFGICMEIDQVENINNFGVQGTLWANFFLGADYRFRYLNQKSVHGLGSYLKFVPDTDLRLHM